MGRERENILLIIDDVERDAEVVSQRLATRQSTNGSQHGERDIAIKPSECPYFAQSRLTAIAVAVEGIGITLQLEPL